MDEDKIVKKLDEVKSEVSGIGCFLVTIILLLNMIFLFLCCNAHIWVAK